MRQGFRSGWQGQRAVGTPGAVRREVGHPPAETRSEVERILGTLFLTREEFEALPVETRRAKLAEVLVAAGWSAPDAGAAVAGFGEGELLERTAAALGHAAEAEPEAEPEAEVAPEPEAEPEAEPALPVPSAAAARLLARVGGSVAEWVARTEPERRAKVRALLVDAGMSAAEAATLEASWPDGELLERVAVETERRRGPVPSARTQATINAMWGETATQPTKKKTSGAGKVALVAILAKLFVG